LLNLKLREELTPARIDRHSGQLEELDVEGHPGVCRTDSAGQLLAGNQQPEMKVGFDATTSARLADRSCERSERLAKVGGPEQRQLEPDHSVVEAARRPSACRLSLPVS
jgi:hypothetical protein